MRSILQLHAATVFSVFLIVGFSHAQSLTPGTVNTPVNQITCPTGFASNATCYASTVSCANIPDLDFYYAVTPVPAGTKQTGTVVFLNGGAGNTIGFADYIPAYTGHGLQSVQVVWGKPGQSQNAAWEETGGRAPRPWSIKTAACRPAGLMQYIFQTYEQHRVPRGAMCAQGTSAGSAAIAYSLAEYGAGSAATGYLDHVELTSGPPLADMAKGCNPSDYENVTVCPGNTCDTGGEGSWSDSSKYVFSVDTAKLDTWAGMQGNVCTRKDSTAWTPMSVVDGLHDSSFSYPKTNMTGWLCSGGALRTHCTGITPKQGNTAAEGQFFYSKVTALKGAPTVYRVDNCSGATGEGIDDGHVPGLSCSSGLTSIEDDMTTNCVLHH